MPTAASGPVTAMEPVGQARFTSRAEVLRAHGDVGAAVSLAQDAGHLRHRGLGVGVNQLGAVGDDAAVLLRRARQVARDVDEDDDRDVEAVAEAHEARRFDRRRDIERAGQVQRLVGDDTHRPPRQPRQANDDVLGVIGVHFQEVGAIDDAVDHLAHVVGRRVQSAAGP